MSLSREEGRSFEGRTFQGPSFEGRSFEGRTFDRTLGTTGGGIWNEETHGGSVPVRNFEKLELDSCPIQSLTLNQLDSKVEREVASVFGPRTQPKGADFAESKDSRTNRTNRTNQTAGRIQTGSFPWASEILDQGPMEPESEAGNVAEMRALDLDLRVRTEANLGFQQMRALENQLSGAPRGSLGRAESQALRTTVLAASAAIAGSFTNIIRVLSAPPPPSAHSSSTGLYRPLESFSSGEADRFGARAESPLSPYDSTPPHSPSRRPNPPAPPAAASRLLMVNSANSTASAAAVAAAICSPCATPPSGSFSEDSPPNPISSPAPPDSEGEPSARIRHANEATTSADADVPEHRALSKKRKFMPRITLKQVASGTDPATDGPPDDGFTWRKYGQKDILGSNHPRSYYRCTHKMEVGCLATKYVQKSDEEPHIFIVTYRGEHRCQSMQQPPFWPYPVTPDCYALALAAAPQQHPSDPNSQVAILDIPQFRGTQMPASQAPTLDPERPATGPLLPSAARALSSGPPSMLGQPAPPPQDTFGYLRSLGIDFPPKLQAEVTNNLHHPRGQDHSDFFGLNQMQTHDSRPESPLDAAHGSDKLTQSSSAMDSPQVTRGESGGGAAGGGGGGGRWSLPMDHSLSGQQPLYLQRQDSPGQFWGSESRYDLYTTSIFTHDSTSAGRGHNVPMRECDDSCNPSVATPMGFAMDDSSFMDPYSISSTF